MDNVIAIVMAGGAGERLQPLTRERSKAAVPFGGKFRLIDLTLSNCVNSGVRRIYVLTQYRSESLNKHIQEGWGISSAGLGDFIYCVPAQQKVGADWYLGTADAVRQNLNLVKRNGDTENILILSGDHVYKMNYMQMIAYHKMRKADVTISAVRTKKEEAIGRLGVLEVDKGYRMVGFEEKPAQPKAMPDAPDYVLSSMGIYVFKTGVLIDALHSGGPDFGRDILPQILSKGSSIWVYDYENGNKIEDYEIKVTDGIREKVLNPRTRDSSYWRDVGAIDSYYEASMDLVGVDPAFNLYGAKWIFRTYQRPLPPSKCILGARTPECIISDGCIISGGTVVNSILSPGVIVERDALVEGSIILDDVTIEPGARIRRAIIDKESRVRAGALLGYNPEVDRQRGCTISDKGIVVVPKSADIGRA